MNEEYQILDFNRPAFVGWTIFQIEYAQTEIICLGHRVYWKDLDETPDQLKRLHEIIPEGAGEEHPAEMTFEKWTDLREEFTDYLDSLKDREIL